MSDKTWQVLIILPFEIECFPTLSTVNNKFFRWYTFCHIM